MSKPDVSAVKDFDKNSLKQVTTEEKNDPKNRELPTFNHNSMIFLKCCFLQLNYFRSLSHFNWLQVSQDSDPICSMLLFSRIKLTILFLTQVIVKSGTALVLPFVFQVDCSGCVFYLL